VRWPIKAKCRRDQCGEGCGPKWGEELPEAEPPGSGEIGKDMLVRSLNEVEELARRRQEKRANSSLYSTISDLSIYSSILGTIVVYSVCA